MSYLNQKLRRHVLLPLYTLLFAAGLVGLSACDMMGMADLMGPSDDSNAARMQVRLVDNPFPFDLVEEVNVTISHVELRGDQEPVLVMDDTATYNLLALQNGVFAELGDVVLPAGVYNEARMTVDEAHVLMKDGQVFNLKVPSGKIKVQLGDINVVDGQDLALTLDFDVSKSFVVQGNPNTPAGIKGFLMKPTVISKGVKENDRRGGDGDGDDDGEEDGEEEGEDGEGDDAGDDGEGDGTGDDGEGDGTANDGEGDDAGDAGQEDTEN